MFHSKRNLDNFEEENSGLSIIFKKVNRILKTHRLIQNENGKKCLIPNKNSEYSRLKYYLHISQQNFGNILVDPSWECIGKWGENLNRNGTIIALNPIQNASLLQFLKCKIEISALNFESHNGIIINELNLD